MWFEYQYTKPIFSSKDSLESSLHYVILQPIYNKFISQYLDTIMASKNYCLLLKSSFLYLTLLLLINQYINPIFSSKNSLKSSLNCAILQPIFLYQYLDKTMVTKNYCLSLRSSFLNLKLLWFEFQYIKPIFSSKDSLKSSLHCAIVCLG